MKENESNEIDRIKDEIEEKYLKVPITDEWKKWFKGESREPLCGVQFTIYLSLKPEKRKKIAKDLAEFLKIWFKSKYPKKLLYEALCKIFYEWIVNKKTVGYENSNQFFQYLYVLALDKIKNEPVAIEKVEQSFEKIDPSDIEKHSFVYLKEEKEDEIIDRIDWSRFLESLDKKKLPVWSLRIDGYSEREIFEKTKIPKTTVHRILKCHKE